MDISCCLLAPFPVIGWFVRFFRSRLQRRERRRSSYPRCRRRRTLSTPCAISPSGRKTPRAFVSQTFFALRYPRKGKKRRKKPVMKWMNKELVPSSRWWITNPSKVHHRVTYIMYVHIANCGVPIRIGRRWLRHDAYTHLPHHVCSRHKYIHTHSMEWNGNVSSEWQ